MGKHMKTFTGAVTMAAVLSCLVAAGAQAAPLFGVDDDWATRADINQQISLSNSLFGPGAPPKTARILVCWCEFDTPGAPPSFARVKVPYEPLAAAGYRPIVSVVGAPPRYSGGHCAASPCFAAPAGPGADAAWGQMWEDLTGTLSAINKRYGIGPPILEIGNEPNLAQFFLPAANPERYTQLLKIAYQNVKSSDKDAVVLGAAISNSAAAGPGGVADDDFVRRMYDAGAKEYMDGIALHTFPGPPEPWTWGSRAKIDRIRAVRDSKGDAGKPLWITNVGISTSGDAAHATATDAEQGVGLASQWRSLAGQPDIAAIVIFRLVDINEGVLWERGLGMWKLGFAEKSGLPKLREALPAAPYAPPTVSVATDTPVVGLNQAARFTASGFPNYPGPLGNPKFQWDTDGNGQPEDTVAGTGPTATRKYTKVGAYTVTVTASDTLEKAKASVTVTVQKDPVSGLDKDPPRLTALEVSALKASKTGPSIVEKAPKGLHNFRFGASEQAVTIFVFHKVVPGRLIGKKCVRPTKSNRRRGKACSVYGALPGSISRYSKPGLNTFRFTGRVRNRRLAKGTYRVSGTPTDPSKNKGTARTANFKITG